MVVTLILAALILLLLNAFFVLAELSSVKMRPSRVEELVNAGDARAKLVEHIQAHMDEYLSVCQVGITLCSIGLGFLGEAATARVIQPAVGSAALAHSLATAVIYLLICFLHVLLGELVPKLIAIRRTDGAALWAARPLEFFRALFYVPLVALKGSATFLLNAAGFPAKMTEPVHTEEELRILLAQSQTTGMMSFRRLLLLENIFDLGDLKVRDAMRGRSGVRVLRVSAPWGENLRTIRESNFSRFPLMDGDEKPLGYVHIKDLLQLDADKMPAADLRALARPFITTTEEAPLESFLAELQRHRRHLALVLGKDGKWTGVISLEDALEEIVGALEDEFAPDQPLFLSDVLSEKRIFLGLRAPSLPDAIRAVLSRVPATELPLPADKIAAAVLEREQAMSTYLGDGLATPHARFENLERPILIFARADDGLPVTDKVEKVHLLFILLTPSSNPRFQARLLARIAGLMGSEFMVERLLEAQTPQAILEAIRAGDPLTLS